MSFVASFAAATAKGETPASEAGLHKIVEVVRAAGPAALPWSDAWRNRILWVDVLARLPTQLARDIDDLLPHRWAPPMIG